MINTSRLTANIDGDFVVFLIGLRINKPLLPHKWMPVLAAMPRMLRELNMHPEMGFIHAEAWFSRTTLMLQYWRSMEQLLAYAVNKDAEHLPAWAAFNGNVGNDGTVGIYHETYQVKSGGYETVYVNMPPFGLGRAGTLVPATGKRENARARLSAGDAPARL